jgi:hypothetical protein
MWQADTPLRGRTTWFPLVPLDGVVSVLSGRGVGWGAPADYPIQAEGVRIGFTTVGPVRRLRGLRLRPSWGQSTWSRPTSAFGGSTRSAGGHWPSAATRA